MAEFLGICDLDPDVEALRAPAPAAEFDIGGDLVEHLADFEVVRDGSPYLIDIATDSDLTQHPLRAAALRGHCGGGWTALRDRDCGEHPRRTALHHDTPDPGLQAHACHGGDRVRILHQLDECGTMRLVECASAAMNASDGVAAVLALACEGLIAVDITRPILPETQVRRRRLPYADPFDF